MICRSADLPSPLFVSVLCPDRTVIQSGPQHLRPVRGSAALFECVFWKDPQLSDAQVVWKKKGHKLQEAANK